MDKKRMEEIGMDVTGALERFMGNETLYIKFLKKFLDDQNYDNLQKEIDNRNADEAFRCAHTLKGLGANLGMMNLYHSIAPLVETLRGGTVENTEEDMKHVTEEYVKIVDFIRTM